MALHEWTELNELWWKFDPCSDGGSKLKRYRFQWFQHRLSVFGAMQMVQRKWRNTFTVSFVVRFRVMNRVRVRVRVRLFSPLRHLHCVEYRKPKFSAWAIICAPTNDASEIFHLWSDNWYSYILRLDLSSNNHLPQYETCFHLETSRRPDSIMPRIEYQNIE